MHHFIYFIFSVWFLVSLNIAAMVNLISNFLSGFFPCSFLHYCHYMAAPDYTFLPLLPLPTASLLAVLRACSVLLSLLFRSPEHLPFPFALICTTLTLNFSLNILLLSVFSHESPPASQPILVPLLDISYLLCLALLPAPWCFIWSTCLPHQW